MINDSSGLYHFRRNTRVFSSWTTSLIAPRQQCSVFLHLISASDEGRELAFFKLIWFLKTVWNHGDWVGKFDIIRWSEENKTVSSPKLKTMTFKSACRPPLSTGIRNEKCFFKSLISVDMSSSFDHVWLMGKQWYGISSGVIENAFGLLAWEEPIRTTLKLTFDLQFNPFVWSKNTTQSQIKQSPLLFIHGKS